MVVEFSRVFCHNTGLQKSEPGVSLYSNRVLIQQNALGAGQNKLQRRSSVRSRGRAPVLLRRLKQRVLLSRSICELVRRPRVDSLLSSPTYVPHPSPPYPTLPHPTLPTPTHPALTRTHTPTAPTQVFFRPISDSLRASLIAKTSP